VYGGLQDNGSWAGPSRSLKAPFGGNQGPINEDWIVLGGGDGFVCRVDSNNPDLVYWEFQDGSMSRRNLKTNEGLFIRPRVPPPIYSFDVKKPILSAGGPLPF